MTDERTPGDLRREVERVHGGWDATWEAIAALDGEFLASYARLAAVPEDTGKLDERTRHLIRLAIDVNATHLYLEDVPLHVRRALAAGATPAEVMEVLECAATLGIHAMNIGVPILVDVLRETGRSTAPGPLSEHQARLKQEFTENRGYWHEFWNEILELDPEFFEAYTDFSSVPWKTGSLEPKVKEFIYIAFDVAATHLYVPGLRLHIANALGYGASPREILGVMELASLLGMHAVRAGAPILAEEARRAH